MIFSYYDDSDTDFEEFSDILAEEQKEKSKLHVSFIYNQY